MMDWQGQQALEERRRREEEEFEFKNDPRYLAEAAPKKPAGKFDDMEDDIPF